MVNKLSELHQLLYVDDYDIVFVTESWLHDNITDGLLDPKSYFSILRKDRTKSRGGGVCVFVRKLWHVVPVTPATEFDDLEIICFDLTISNSHVRFFVLYRPPSYDETYMCNVIKYIRNYESTTYTNVIIGDINLPKIDWNSLTCTGDILHKQFLLFVIESGYCQLVDFPTHNENLLDVLLTTDTKFFSSIKPDIPFGSSDHTSVKFSMLFYNDYSPGQNTHASPSVYNWRMADYDAIESYLTQINWYNLVSLYPSASVLWDVFMAILLSCVDQFVPRINVSSKSSRGNSTKVSREIRKCLSKKRSLWKRLQTKRFDTAIHTKYRECCFNYKSLIQQHELRTEKRVIDANHLGYFYKFINQRIYDRSDVGVLVDTDNTVIVDNCEKANVFNTYFASVWQEDNNAIHRCENLNVTPIESISLEEGDVLYAIKKLKSNYTCGPDGLPAIFFKRLGSTLVVPLTVVFKQLLSVSYVPDVWKKAIITPVHKKGTATDCSNYRPISITCVCCKLLERIIVNKLHDHLSTNNILHQAQHGFTKGRSTLTNLLESVNDWTLCLQNKQQVDVVYIDFRKAFDVVSHKKNCSLDCIHMAFKVSCWSGWNVYILEEPTAQKLVMHCLMKLTWSVV